MLELGLHLNIFNSSVGFTETEVYSELIMMILDRGELSLSFMNFGDDPDEMPESIYVAKQQVAEHYINLLVKVLEDVTNKLHRRNTIKILRTYSSSIIAQGYLVFENFRNLILDII